MTIFDILKISGAAITSVGLLGALAVYLLNKRPLEAEKDLAPFRCSECGGINTVTSEELHLVGDLKKALSYTGKAGGALYPYYCPVCRHRTMQQLVSAPVARPARENFKKQLGITFGIVLVGVVLLVFSFIFASYFAAKTTGTF